MEYALYLLIAGGLGVSTAAALVRTWSLHSRLYSLEDRCNVLEGTVQREVKIRAAAERWKRSDRDIEMVASAVGGGADSSPKIPWWQKPNLKRGAHLENGK